MRIAKVAVTNVMIWVCAWTPYAVVVMIGQVRNTTDESNWGLSIPQLLTILFSCNCPLNILFLHFNCTLTTL